MPRLLTHTALAACAVAFLSGLTPPLWTPSAISAVEVGPAFRTGAPGVLGMDGAYSLPIGNRQSLWIFGDTLLGTWQPNGGRVITGMPSSTGAIAPDHAWVSGYPRAQFVGGATPSPLLVAAKPNAKRRLWPLDATMAGGKAWLYYVEIEPFGRGPLDFKVTGVGVAEGEGLPPKRFKTLPAFWPEGAPSYGTSVMNHQGWRYLYAGGDPSYVARQPLHRPDQGGITYWAGEDQWVSDWKKAEPLPGSGPEMSVRYNRYLDAFVMIYVPPFGDSVVARFAKAPEGPWSAPKAIARCQPADGSGVMFYGAKQHAQLDIKHGRTIVVTYNTNGPEALLEDRPDIYWPRVLRVTFEK